MTKANLGKEETSERDLHQDTLVERLAQNSTNKSVPVETVCFKADNIRPYKWRGAEETLTLCRVGAMVWVQFVLLVG
jgi:hypothetical protein